MSIFRSVTSHIGSGHLALTLELASEYLLSDERMARRMGVRVGVICRCLDHGGMSCGLNPRNISTPSRNL
jgi:predicted nucleic acid-binding protein